MKKVTVDSSDTKPVLVPKLRFPEFQNAPEWAERSLGSCLDYEQPTPYLVSDTNYSPAFETPVLTAGKTFILGYTNERHGIYSKNLPVIIFDDFTTATQFVDFPFKAKSSAMKILTAKDGADIKFMFERLQMLSFEVGAHERHWISTFAPMLVAIPEYPEQQKIAECLGSLDELIGAEREKLDALKAYKKGLMQQLFPREGETVPRLRFPEFRGAGEWEVRPLGDLVKFSSGGTPSKENPAYWNGSIPWISASSMYETSVRDSELRVTEDAIGNGTRLAAKGSLLILVRGSMLFNRVPICIAAVDVAFNQDVKALALNQNVDGVFLLQQLLAVESRIPIDRTGIGAGKIDTEALEGFAIGAPSSAEQSRIATFLASIDDGIASLSEKIEHLQVHKQALMQQLFPSQEVIS